MFSDYPLFHKYTKIRALGDLANKEILTTFGKVVIQEKIDGANFAFRVRHNIIHFFSHNQYLTNDVEIDRVGIPSGWKAIEPVLKSWQEHPIFFVEDYYYYAESMQKHTIPYSEEIPGCIGYDILNLKTMKLIHWEMVKIVFNAINLPFINIIEERDARTVTLGYLKTLYKKSAYRDGSAEGIIIKRYDIKTQYGEPMFAKIVDDDFKELNKSLFKGDREPRKLTTEDRIAEMYATPGRIEKMIHKMVDEGYEINMPMMKDLFGRVVEDILEEEIVSIYKEYNSIDFKSLNKTVSKKCPRILKNVIMRN